MGVTLDLGGSELGAGGESTTGGEVSSVGALLSKGKIIPHLFPDD